MSEERKSLPEGVPQPVFGITRQQLARIVEGNRAALGLPPQTAQAPGRPAGDPVAEEVNLQFENWFGSEGYDDDGIFDSEEMERAFESGYRDGREALTALRNGIEELLADVAKSAEATRPSRKTEVEDEFAIALRRLLETE